MGENELQHHSGSAPSPAESRPRARVSGPPRLGLCLTDMALAFGGSLPFLISAVVVAVATFLALAVKHPVAAEAA